MNRADRRKFHYLYKITRIKDGKYYVGIHSTDNMDDGYFGSGNRIRYSLNKYGIEAHRKEILEVLPTRALVLERERDVVNEQMLADPLCLNLAKGGQGEPFPVRPFGRKRGPMSEETKAKISAANKGKTRSEEVKQKLSESHVGRKYKVKRKFKTKKAPATEETKQKIREKQLGKKASEETREKMRLAKLGKKRGAYKKPAQD